ncbi:phosphotransferase [Candidatus Gottesmanbacteria bacterium]|nr:phosphotransferase [Candidatus Gottesmanbacteria bacterium]
MTDSINEVFYPVAHRSDEEIAALKKRYDLFDENLIPSIVRVSIGMTAVSWRKPESWSTSHVIYIVTVSERERPIVIRANIGWGSPETYMKVEKLITDEVATIGVPVNRILYVDVSRENYPFDFQIQDMLDGTDIEANFHGTRMEYDALSFDLGVFIAKWGELEYDGFGRLDPKAATKGKLTGTKASMYDYMLVRLDEDIRYLVDAKVIAMPQSDAIRKLFEDHKPVMQVKKGTLVQYDLADHNIMFDGVSTITGVFDWEAAVIGDPVLDLASAPTWKTVYPREAKLIEGYRSIRPLPSFFREKMNIYRLRTMIWKMVYAIRSGILNEDRKRKFEAALLPYKI